MWFASLDCPSFDLCFFFSKCKKKKKKKKNVFEIQVKLKHFTSFFSFYIPTLYFVGPIIIITQGIAVVSHFCVKEKKIIIRNEWCLNCLLHSSATFSNWICTSNFQPQNSILVYKCALSIKSMIVWNWIKCTIQIFSCTNVYAFNMIDWKW